jgi:hypothetical protein
MFLIKNLPLNCKTSVLNERSLDEPHEEQALQGSKGGDF